MNTALNGQADAAGRLALTRLSLAWAIILLTTQMPKGRFLIALAKADGWATGRLRMFDALRAATVVAVGAWGLGSKSLYVRVLANALFFCVTRELERAHPRLWSYTTHLNFTLLALSFDDTGGFPLGGFDLRRDSTAGQQNTIALLQAGYGFLYLQSGIAKLLHAGIGWTDGKTLRAVLAELGTPLGTRLSSRPLFTRAASIGTVAFELAFLPTLLLSRRARPLLGLSSMFFHESIRRTMGISFWPLASLAPALFIIPKLWLSRRSSLAPR